MKKISLIFALAGMIFFVTPAVSSEWQCECVILFSRVLSLPPDPVNDIPASDSPQTGYADLGLHCELDFEAFDGKTHATDSSDNGTMCGGQCTKVGKYCGYLKNCKHDKDCGEGLLCESGQCQEISEHSSGYSSFYDDKAINKFNCTGISDEKDPYWSYKSNLLKPEYGTDKRTVDVVNPDNPTVKHVVDQPCGGFCSAYFEGFKCEEGKRCKTNLDCQSGACSVGSDTGDEKYGVCQPGNYDPTVPDKPKKDPFYHLVPDPPIFFTPSYVNTQAETEGNAKIQALCTEEAGLHETTKPPYTIKTIEEVDYSESVDSVSCTATEIKAPPPPVSNEINGKYKFAALDIEGLRKKASGLNQIGVTDPKKFIGRFIKGLLGVIGSLSLVMFIYGGILLMTDAGSTERATKGKEIIVWTTAGLAVIFASYALVDFILEAFR